MDDGAFVALALPKSQVLKGEIPFLSSIVTVSFAHFMRNLPGWKKGQ